MKWLDKLPTLSPRARKWLPRIGYPAFYLLSLIVFFKATFPYERLAHRIEAAFNAEQKGPDKQRLDIGEMSSYWLTGVEAENIRLIGSEPDKSAAEDPVRPRNKKKGEPDADADNQAPVVMAPATTIEHAHASVSLLRLVVGTLYVGFGADAFGGELAGTLADSDAERSIEAELDDLDVGQVPMIREIVGLPMKGQLSGVVDLRMPEAKLSEATGRIELTIEGLQVGDGKAKIQDTIALPRLDAGTVNLVADVEEGKLEVEKMTVSGQDVELELEGTIKLRDSFEQSLGDLTLSFRFTDRYKNKSDMTRGLFGAPGSKAPGAFDLDPKNRAAKAPDGSYNWRLSGTLANLDSKPGRVGTSPKRRGRTIRR